MEGYVFWYWYLVDVFVYFLYLLVIILFLGWINVGYKYGVLVSLMKGLL